MVGELLAKQVLLAADGPAWHGPGLLENLEGMSAAQAAAHPVPAAHSVWELVLHLTVWTREVERRLGGGAPGEPPEGDWPAVGAATEDGWKRARAALRESHVSLGEAVRRFPEARWGTPLGGGKSDSYAETILGALQHDGYHGGQIGLLRKTLGVAG